MDINDTFDLGEWFKSVKDVHLSLISGFLSNSAYNEIPDADRILRAQAILLFLSFIDKITSLAYIFLYISDRIKATDLQMSNKKEYYLTVLACEVGLTKKIKYLYDIGAIKKSLSYVNVKHFIEERNSILHGMLVQTGYNFF